MYLHHELELRCRYHVFSDLRELQDTEHLTQYDGHYYGWV